MIGDSNGEPVISTCVVPVARSCCFMMRFCTESPMKIYASRWYPGEKPDLLSGIPELLPVFTWVHNQLWPEVEKKSTCTCY
jgi:hypothetical protein